MVTDSRSGGSRTAVSGSSGDRGRNTVVDKSVRGAQDVDAGAGLDAVFGEVAAERPRAWHPVKRANEMPCDRMQPRTPCELLLDVWHDGLEDVPHRRVRRRLPE